MTAPYLQPTSTTPLPNGLTLAQFIQTVMVGVSGLPGPMVRPKWQVAPPKQPDIETNWMAMGIEVSTPDANAYVDENASQQVVSQRTETLEVSLSIYGPAALEIYGLIRDGFQIPNNLFALYNANMGFVEVTAGRHIPDLINERFINRVVASVILRRLVQRIYPILTITSATGGIYTVLGTEPYLLDFVVSQ